MKKVIALLVIYNLSLVYQFLNAQNLGINATGANAAPSAILDIDAAGGAPRGVLFPRLTTVQRNSIVAPALSLFIFNTDNHCFEAYETNNSTWYTLFCIGCQTPTPFSTLPASNISPTQFIANWSVSTNATSYSVEVATDASFTSMVSGYNNLNVNNTQSISVTGLNCGIYYYRVTATNSCGILLSSNTQSVNTSAGGSSSLTFNYTGATQSFTVPQCVTTVTVKVWGAGGGSGSTPSAGVLAGIGGGGGFVSSVLTVIPGETIRIEVGSGGTRAIGTSGGCYGNGGNGGGYSGVFRIATPLLIAGSGGGGGGGGCTNSGGNGGAGGGNVAQDGQPGPTCLNSHGRGGNTTTSTGGVQGTGCDSPGAGAPTAGTSLLGGNGSGPINAISYIGGGRGGVVGAGGGGGYFGGGGSYYGLNGNGGGGGGGSSYTTGTSVVNTQAIGSNSANNTDIEYVNGIGVGGTINNATTGQNGGNGMLIIKW